MGNESCQPSVFFFDDFDGIHFFNSDKGQSRKKYRILNIKTPFTKPSFLPNICQALAKNVAILILIALARASEANRYKKGALNQ